jgi:hypothetical protein
MQIEEVKVAALSDLKVRVYLCNFNGIPAPSALVYEFSGKYGEGSQGNDDATFMRATKAAYRAAWHVHAEVFDLRAMEYAWGNGIWNVFRDLSSWSLPAALVVSDLCRAGFASCGGIVPPMFDDLQAALKHVELPARARLQSLFDHLHIYLAATDERS